MVQPAVFLLDEPTANLAPQVAAESPADLGTSGRWPKPGAGVLVVEQRARAVLAISDYTYVLGGGQVLMADTPARLAASEEFTESFFVGRSRRRPKLLPPATTWVSMAATSSRRLRTPNLSKAAVRCSWTIDPGQADGTARGGHSENLALMRTAGREMLGDHVTPADEDAHVAVPVEERDAEHSPGRPHSFPVGGHAHRRVVVDEILGEVFADGAEITLGE